MHFFNGKKSYFCTDKNTSTNNEGLLYKTLKNVLRKGE